MSGKQEKRRRREEGISIDAKRGEAEFARLAVRHRDAREERSANRRASRPRALAVGALAVIAALAAAGIGSVL